MLNHGETLNMISALRSLQSKEIIDTDDQCKSGSDRTVRRRVASVLKRMQGQG